MLPKSDWAHLIPHAGAMCLLDEVVEWDATRLHARSATHQRTDNPLRADGMLHAVNLCEYAAQAMAVHGALRERAAGGAAQPGFLVALREVALNVERIDDLPGRLQVHVECLIAMPGSLQYAFRIEHRGSVLATGRAAVMHQTAGA
ncbi:MAG: 3-hydroxydecanoyl-[ACP] dehydratase [Rhodanobacteraceae bacterium]|jgi:predicted hotdog family 3-hydroxylacyl-ACP dehydratase|nr:MAG: 3-hydroxydecanoyl-[ACP] dehydratase [Rhodanobacteraceae bacterium]